MGVPTATVTFLFSDIEGSTKQWERHPGPMAEALSCHDSLVRGAIERHGGHVFKTIGDAFCAVFLEPEGALSAAVDCQRAIAVEPWPEPIVMAVRMAVHTGTAEFRDEDYFGPPLNRVARLLAAGHGGQVLLSQAAERAVQGKLGEGCSLRDMGERRLKDLVVAERVYQLVAPGLNKDFPPLITLDARSHNLPVFLTTFVGRERESEKVKALLMSSRLVTLTGAGGCGKTRLALQTAADVIDDFDGGVWLLEVATLNDGALLPQALATILDVREEPGVSVDTTLLRHLKDKRLLVLLDNCEHLVQACASLCESVLTACPQVRILASSREALRVPGEAAYRVPSLATPDPSRDTTAESVLGFETVRLFRDRAVQVQSAFEVTDQNASDLASICHRLDGIPLALELAAARVRSMSVQEVHRRLDQCFRLLTGGSRTALPRQQTLRSLIDWSFDLLDEKEQALFVRLSVFSGGWTLEDAERVCFGGIVEDFEVLDLLTSLTDKSLVIADLNGPAARYRFLATVGQYAREKLNESGTCDLWSRRHFENVLKFVEEAEPHLVGAGQQAWLGRLESDIDNLRAALLWSIEAHEDSGQCVRLCCALRRLWTIRGLYQEGRSWFQSVLGRLDPSGETADRGHALYGTGVLAWLQGDLEAATGAFEESLRIRQALGDRRGAAASQCSLGVVALDRGDLAYARSVYEGSLETMVGLGDKLGTAVSLCNLGAVALEQGDIDAARRFCEQGLEVQKELGDTSGIAYSMDNLGSVSRMEGNLASSRRHYEDSLELRRELSDRPGIGYTLIHLARTACEMGDLDVAVQSCEESLSIFAGLSDKRGAAQLLEAGAQTAVALDRPVLAAQLWGAATSMRQESGAPASDLDRRSMERWMDTARQLLGGAAYDAAFEEGRCMSRESALERARLLAEP